MNCFICGTHLNSIRFMLHHFRLLHNLTEKDDYICTFGENCNQHFTLLSSLTRHVKRHRNFGENAQTSSSIPILGSCSVQSTSSSHNSTSPDTFRSRNDYVNVPSTSTEVFNCQNDTLSTCTVSSNDRNEALDLPIAQNDSFQQKGIEFALKLHSKNNFTRKDVDQIKANVIQNIIDPIVKSFTQLIKQNIRNEFEQRLFQSSMNVIVQPFCLCTNENQLFKWLREDDYVTHFNEFTINRELM